MASFALGKFFARRRPAVDWAVVPATTREIEAVVRHCRRIVSRRALVAAGVSAVPLPGVDWITDVAILMRLIPDINQAFGLTPEQIERLAPDRQVVVYKAISAGGGMLIGKLVTRDLVVQLLRFVGVRLTTQQAAKYVPIAGQAVSAALTYSALRYVWEQHIRQCVAVSKQLLLTAPAPAEAPDAGEVNYPYLFDVIDSLDWDGCIGCEYRPAKGTSEGLGWLRRERARA
jgi:uncharacterized protein (DUF697 family)